LADRQNGAGTIVSLGGEFDLAQRGRVTDTFAAVADEPLVVLDLERTRYVDSTALSCLLRLRSDLSERGGKLVLSGARPALQRLLDIAGLSPLFDSCGTLAEAGVQYGFADGQLRRIELNSDEE
jgi:anti-anti-sigma factor